MAENLSLQNFDWDAYESSSKGTLNEELTQKYDATLSAIKDNEVVEGTVISINKREVVVNVGYKSDGIVPATEFRYNPELKVGDRVEVYIESQEDKKDNSFFHTKKHVHHAAGNVLMKHSRKKKSLPVTSNAVPKAV